MNMRKIIAVLSAVLMLCAIIPMSVFAAPGDVIISKNFDDGSYFSNGSNENGYMVFNATTADWANVYLYANAIKSGTKYEITFDCKANKAANINVKINNNWSGDTFKWTTNVTTEWATYTTVINPDELATLTSTALLMFTSNTTAANGAIYHIDNVVVKEYKDPATIGKVTNGDFETGNLSGWTAHQSTTISTNAHSGSYAANVKGNGGWGGMLNQDVSVEAGKTYSVSLWAKTISNGVNVQVKDGGTSGNNMASTWFTKTEWTNLTWEVTPTTDVICFNFCGGGNGIAEDVLVDDITLIELKDPSFDGYITNGDFEVGKIAGWTNLWGSTSVEIVEGRDGGYAIKGTASGSYNIVYQEVAVTPNTNYTVWAYTKNASGSNLWIKNAGGNGDITNKAFASGEWALTSVTFNSGSNSTVWVGLMGVNAGATYIVDDVFMFEAKEQSNDGYIKNGTFETGSVSPWDNLWGSCPTVEIIKGGKDDTFALNLVSGQWKHLRQTGIAVEANTDYKISLWSKNVKNINLLVKDNADTTNVINKGIANSDDWALTEITFNTGSYTSILVSLMGGAEEAYGQFDNIVMEKLHTCNVVEQNRVDADCVNDGYIEYACDCGLGAYTETIPAKGHTAGAAADCENAQVCTVCGAELAAALGHDWDDATCTAPKTCSVCGATEGDALGHSYSNEFDVDCDVCGEIREIETPVVKALTSASEDVSGVAALFGIDVDGLAIKEGTKTEADYTNATVNGNKLISMGAIASNGNSSVDIPVVYMYELDEEGTTFAIRVKNIPADKYDAAITFVPYFIVEIDGEQVTIYGDAVIDSYNGIIG